MQKTCDKMLRVNDLFHVISKLPFANGALGTRTLVHAPYVGQTTSSELRLPPNRSLAVFSRHGSQDNCCSVLPSNCVHLQARRDIGSLWGGSKVTEWNKAVSEAEKIVGFSTSFLSLRYLLSDELSNVAMHMKKLVGTGHPLLKTARKLFYDDEHSMQTRGLMVLLISKAAGPSPENSESVDVMTSGIYQSQRTLAEITEMIHTASLIHKGLVNIDPESMKGDAIKEMEFGNKMAVLSGDFLLANASTGLADLNNTKVAGIIASAVGDLMKAEFTKLRDKDCGSFLPKEGASVGDWETQTFLSSASLIAKSCQAAMMLARHPKCLQDAAFEFGKQIAFAHRTHQELQPLLTKVEDGNDLTVTSLPVILYIRDQQLAPEAQKLLAGEPIATKKLVKILKASPAVIEESKRMCCAYGQKALESLGSFPQSDAKDALKKIVKAVTTF